MHVGAPAARGRHRLPEPWSRPRGKQRPARRRRSGGGRYTCLADRKGHGLRPLLRTSSGIWLDKWQVQWRCARQSEPGPRRRGSWADIPPCTGPSLIGLGQGCASFGSRGDKNMIDETRGPRGRAERTKLRVLRAALSEAVLALGVSAIPIRRRTADQPSLAPDRPRAPDTLGPSCRRTADGRLLAEWNLTTRRDRGGSGQAKTGRWTARGRSRRWTGPKQGSFFFDRGLAACRVSVSRWAVATPIRSPSRWGDTMPNHPSVEQADPRIVHRNLTCFDPPHAMSRRIG